MLASAALVAAVVVLAVCVVGVMVLVAPVVLVALVVLEPDWWWQWWWNWWWLRQLIIIREYRLCCTPARPLHSQRKGRSGL